MLQMLERDQTKRLEAVVIIRFQLLLFRRGLRIRLA